MKQWYENDPGLYESEKASMAGTSMILVKDNIGNLAWKGYVNPTGNRKVPVVLAYPSNFPYGRVNIYVKDAKIMACNPPHQMSEGEMCAVNANIPTHLTTARAYFAWAAAWVFSAITYMNTGIFPELDQIKNHLKKRPIFNLNQHPYF